MASFSDEFERIKRRVEQQHKDLFGDTLSGDIEIDWGTPAPEPIMKPVSHCVRCERSKSNPGRDDMHARKIRNYICADCSNARVSESKPFMKREIIFAHAQCGVCEGQFSKQFPSRMHGEIWSGLPFHYCGNCAQIFDETFSAGSERTRLRCPSCSKSFRLYLNETALLVMRCGRVLFCPSCSGV